MIVIFTSRSAKGDPQTDAVSSALRSRCMPHAVLNPHASGTADFALEQTLDGIVLYSGASRISVSAFYFSSLWRTDCIALIPPHVRYPSMFRHAICQFLQDLRFAFEHLRWIPGHLESIERADSKPFMLFTASQLGITVPTFTRNSYSPPKDIESGMFYRKNLGHPFSISYSRPKGTEVGVTITNQLARVEDGEGRSEQPWQWQEFIDCSAQIRCVVVGSKVWSAIWHRTDESFGSDYRYVNQIQQKTLVWSL